MIKVDIIVKNWLDTSTSPSALGRLKNVEGQVVTKGLLIENCFYFFCLWTSFSLQIKWGQIPIPHCPHMFRRSPLPHYYCTKRILLPPFCMYANYSYLWTSFSLHIKSSGVKSPFPIVPICSAGPHCPIAIAPSAYSCLPFARQSFMSVNKFLLAGQLQEHAVARLSQNKNREKKRPGKRKQRNLSGRWKYKSAQ